MSALAVRKLRLGGFHNLLSDVRPHVAPWQCLVCGTGYADGTLAHRALSYLTHTLIAADRPDRRQAPVGTDDGSLSAGEFEALTRRYFEPRLSAEPPGYVTSLLSGEQIELPSGLGAVLAVAESGGAA